MNPPFAKELHYERVSRSTGACKEGGYAQPTLFVLIAVFVKIERRAGSRSDQTIPARLLC